MSPPWAVSATAGNLSASAERHAARYAMQTTAPVGSTSSTQENPNKKIALILGGVGVGLIVLGAAAKGRYDCTFTTTTYECGGGKKKALVLLGVLAGGAGAAMYVIGEGKKASTAIGISPSGIGVQQRLRF